jgi:hypothetical protein
MGSLLDASSNRGYDDNGRSKGPWMGRIHAFATEFKDQSLSHRRFMYTKEPRAFLLAVTLKPLRNDITSRAHLNANSRVESTEEPILIKT